MDPESSLEELRQEEYYRRLVVDRLRREIFSQSDPTSSPELTAQLLTAEEALAEIEKAISRELSQERTSGLPFEHNPMGGLLGSQESGLVAAFFLRLAAIPTAIYHLLNPNHLPLVTITVRNVREKGTLRLRIISYIERYSAQAVDTVELAPDTAHTLHQLPVLFSGRLSSLPALGRASLHVRVEDLDGGLVLHHSLPIWLLPTNSAPLALRDPQSGAWHDLSMYFGAFVTPNSPAVMRFLRLAAEHHPTRQIVGYQGGQEEVELQVRAAFDALKTESRITYQNTVLEFNPDQGFATQRVRLPRESINERSANCLDGVVLFASLLEAMALGPAIVVVPGHTLLGWETDQASGEWHYLETTMIHSHTFSEAVASGEETARRYAQLAEKTGLGHFFQVHPLRLLRTRHGITPVE